MFDLLGDIPYWFKGEDNRVSLYSSVRISRNFKDINFPSSPGYSSYRMIEKKTDEVLKELLSSGRIKKKPLSSASQEEIIKFKKLRILPEKRNDIISKLTLYFDTESKAFLLTNYKDHLTFFSHSAGSNVSKAYSSCNTLAAIFDDSLFVKDKLGNYHTSGIDYFGSGMKCFSVLALPVLRLSGKANEIISSFEHNKLSVRNYFNSVNDSFLIISNKDSFSRPSARQLSELRKILSELKKMSEHLILENTEKTNKLKQECLEIINFQSLTFSHFMKIYNIVSLLRLTGKTKIRISEVNSMLGSILLDSSGITNNGLKKSLIKVFTEKIKKELKLRG